MTTHFEGVGTLLLDGQMALPVFYALNFDGADLQGTIFSDDAGLPELYPVRLVLSDEVSFIVVCLTWNSVDEEDWLVVYDLRLAPDQPDHPANLLQRVAASDR